MQLRWKLQRLWKARVPVRTARPESPDRNCGRFSGRRVRVASWKASVSGISRLKSTSCHAGAPTGTSSGAGFDRGSLVLRKPCFVTCGYTSSFLRRESLSRRLTIRPHYSQASYISECSYIINISRACRPHRGRESGFRTPPGLRPAMKKYKYT